MVLLYPAEMTRFALNRFVVLGRVGMDLYAHPPGTRVEEALSFTPALGGSAGNIAVAGTAVVSRALTMTYDVTTTKWYPSYV